MGAQQAVSFRERIGDPPSRLLQPHVLLPTQQNRAGGIPEKRLLIAMLADAVNCFQRHGMSPGRGNRRAARESEVWIMSRDRDWPFSFENVCEFLEIDASYVRASLVRWRAHQRLCGPPSGRVRRMATVHRLRSQYAAAGGGEAR